MHFYTFLYWFGRQLRRESKPNRTEPSVHPFISFQAKLNHVILHYPKRKGGQTAQNQLNSHLQCVKKRKFETHSISYDRHNNNNDNNNNNYNDTVNIIKSAEFPKKTSHIQHAAGNNISHLFASMNFALAGASCSTCRDPFGCIFSRLPILRLSSSLNYSV